MFSGPCRYSGGGRRNIGDAQDSGDANQPAMLFHHGHPWPSMAKQKTAAELPIEALDPEMRVWLSWLIIPFPYCFPSSGSKKFRAGDNSTGSCGWISTECRMHVTITYVSTVFRHFRLAVGISGMLPSQTAT